MFDSFLPPRFILVLTLQLILFFRCRATTIQVTPADNYTKIEGAKPGDEVVIAPGTYAFRVYLTKQATPTNPIVIRAQDPANPPVWDFGTTLVENAPGSYTAGDRGRGGWQFSGARDYTISGIVIRNARTATFNSAGIRYYNTSTNIYLKNCVFTQNDNGLTGGTQDSDITVEYCEFYNNGNLSASSSAPTHNIYIYGGYFTMRYCYVHDSTQSQNFHLRPRNGIVEYNWFARAKAYEGDLMTDDDFSGTGPFKQTLVFRGNVLVQAAAPNNHGQVIALYNDAGLANLTLSAQVIYNTFIGNGGNAALVHVSNADGTRMQLEESNNLIYGTTQAYLVENAGAATITGTHNWLQTNATTGVLTASVQTPTPGFRNLAQQDYRLASGSSCIAAASDVVYGLPGREYFLNETTNRLWRVRAAAYDIGAFESTSTGLPIGPYDPAPLPRLVISGLSSGSSTLRWPLFADDFVLEKSGLTFPPVWTSAALPLSTNGNGISASAVISGAGQLFHLRK